MKTANRIMGIISLAMGGVCIIPTTIGMLAGISGMTDEEIAYRAIAYILFEAFIFVGGAIAFALSSKPKATVFAAILLIVAGVLQINFNADFNLEFIGSITLLIFSWVAVISIAFGCLVFIFSIITIKKKTNQGNTISNDEQYSQTDVSTDPSNEIRKYKSLLDDGMITQEEFDAKKKQLLNL